jgi:hypothetical protein
MSAHDMRASFSSAPCGNFEPGPHHPGHMRCVRFKRSIEAGIRQRRYGDNPTRVLQRLVAKSTTEYKPRARRKKR